MNWKPQTWWLDLKKKKDARVRGKWKRDGVREREWENEGEMEWERVKEWDRERGKGERWTEGESEKKLWKRERWEMEWGRASVKRENYGVSIYGARERRDLMNSEKVQLSEDMTCWLKFCDPCWKMSRVSFEMNFANTIQNFRYLNG